ncbi:hypothetical protein PTH_1891 [Pelotomaculum thermopropionicum SI]|uniref:Uncharacterized protein n=1 Tax=Pelotomaculum thermopropionicum (strain DSM 13744 / JCM 10971 / SI) TaxID=370438 RepID=A5D0Z5_PELTS|nr:hypothetical protein PTH_1891 [Pelotomaculum thermopropionicum SI]
METLREPAKMKEAIEAHLESWERRKRKLDLLVGPFTRQLNNCSIFRLTSAKTLKEVTRGRTI